MYQDAFGEGGGITVLGQILDSHIHDRTSDVPEHAILCICEIFRLAVAKHEENRRQCIRQGLVLVVESLFSRHEGDQIIQNTAGELLQTLLQGRAHRIEKEGKTLGWTR
jgi:hypothetical protein